MDDPELRGREPHDLSIEARESFGDADHERSTPGEQLLHMPGSTRAEGIVVVLRRHEHGARPYGRERAVHVGMDEMGVHEVGAGRANRTDHSPCQPWVGVPRAGQALERDLALGERLVEGVRMRTRVVETQERGLDPCRPKRGQQFEHVPLRAADSADALEVQNPHDCVAAVGQRARSSPQARTRAAAARTASRKSMGALERTVPAKSMATSVL